MRYRRKSNSPARQGFTLVEILVVLVIIGIAAAMIVPRVVNMGDIQASSAGRALLADLQFAQNEALVTQKPVTVSFSTAESSYTLSDAGGTLTHPTTKKPFVMQLAETKGFDKVHILSASFGGNASVTFDTYGAPDNAGQVQLEADGHRYTINVAAVTGRMTVVYTEP